MKLLKLLYIVPLVTTVILAKNTQNNSNLTSSIETKSNEFVQDIKKDGMNFNFFAKVSHVDAAYETAEASYINTMPKSTLFGTVGMTLLPNTWKINLSYTGTIGENILFKSSAYDEFETNLDSYNGNYPVDESKKDTSWLNLYIKPISIDIGEFGFGYTIVQKQVILEVYDTSHNTKVTNLRGNNGKSLITDENNKYFKFNTKTSRIFATYNIKPRGNWYDGFGVLYGYETSNKQKLLENYGDILIDPDATSHIFAIGINKTLDEVKTGIGFKTLTYGIVKSKYEYYNYDLSKNQTLSSDEKQLDVELIFMFKPRKNKQFYLSGKVLLREEDDTDAYYSEAKLELGVLF